MIVPEPILPYIASIRHLSSDSHKGQNGKVMVIGGSELFHAASRWALDVVSGMVDMVFYSSVPENNELIHEAKKNFWSGMVVPRGEIENYIGEADVILIGPGMTRDESIRGAGGESSVFQEPTRTQWDTDTYLITNYLVSKYPDKKWVIDAGALQMVEPWLLQKEMIITPHHLEYEKLMARTSMTSRLQEEVTILLKGKEDQVSQGKRRELITGGNPGMTKGGTGDVLAGLVAGLFVYTDDPLAAAVVGSYVNKKAGDDLYTLLGPFFTTNQLVEKIPQTLKEVLGY